MLKKFLIMVDNDVAGTIVFDISKGNNQEAYDSFKNNNYRMIIVDAETEVMKGWIYDGNSFYDPSISS